MNRPRIVAGLVVVFVFIGAAAFAFTLEPADETPVLSDAEPLTTSTGEPDFEPLVESGFVGELAAAESELTDEAIDRSTSTTSTTTTTLAPSTTTSRPAPKKDSPPQTSPPTTAASSQAGYSSSAESDFASRINSFRGSNGQAGLSRSGSLDSYARSWAKKMAQAGGLSHSNIGSLLGTWSSVGENVGMGGSVGSIFNALQGSSGHRSNMLGDFTHVGVGVWRDSAGALWTAHVFAK